jgi:hypothetical protein
MFMTDPPYLMTGNAINGRAAFALGVGWAVALQVCIEEEHARCDLDDDVVPDRIFNRRYGRRVGWLVVWQLIQGVDDRPACRGG